MDWPTRQNICLEVANGLQYLHEGVQPLIIHGDIKASNILLDKDLHAKIADFDLARIFKEDETITTQQIVGTMGYLAPEYATQGLVSQKIDIYSLGVLLLEIVSGRRSIVRGTKKHMLLTQWVSG
jgi:serine/threonine protein kinase